MNERVARLEFFRGVLCGLRHYCDRFDTWPTVPFHLAFGAMIEEAKKSIPSDNGRLDFILDINIDPLFGV